MNVTEKKKEIFKKETEDTDLRSIWEEEGETQEKYTKWSKKVVGIAEKIFMTGKKNRRVNRKIRILREKRKKLKKEAKEKEGEEKKILIERRKVILEHICKLKREERKEKARKVAKKLKSENGFDINAFWKHAERMKGRKAETATSMENEKGEIEIEPEKIKEIYKQFYQKLLEKRLPTNEDEERIETNRNKCIEIMQEVAKRKEIKPVDDEEYARMKNGLKRKKAPDKQGWRYEWVKWAGKDLEQSIKMMLNSWLEKKDYPVEWKQMNIKSISKDGRKKMKMENRRGLFLTNILSKIMEKVLINRGKEVVDRSMTQFQNGGVKGKSIADNLFALNTIIDHFKNKKQNLYILYADLEKCFDKLCLQDCIIELEETGVQIEEAMYVYGMNKKIRAMVETPHGKTEEFTIEEAVRQGTIWGPTLCCISTDRINKIIRQQTVIGDIEIKCPTYVDDIVGAGTIEMIKDMEDRMTVLETTKKLYSII